MSNQTKTWDDPSSIDTTGFSPIIITGILVQLLRQFFSSRDQILNPVLKDNVWSPDLNSTGILIESVTKLKIEDLERRPAILVKRNAHKAMQNMIAYGEEAADLKRPGEGITYNQVWVGSSTIFGIGRNAAEAEVLAEEASGSLRQYAPLIRGDFSFLRFSVLEIGPAGKLQESQEHFAVPVTFGYGYWERWTVAQESPVVMKFEVKTAIE